MHVSNEVNQELERFVRQRVVIVRRPTAASLGLSPVLQDPCDVSHRTKDVHTFPARPPTLPREETRVGWMVPKGPDIVQRGGPPHFEADFVRPRSDGCEVAERDVWVRGGKVENVAHGGEDGGVEVYLRNGRDYFVS